MEKEPQPESMATVTIKPDYPPSEYSSEPPPAYHKPKSTAVQITKIVAVTVVLSSVILGSFLLASAYVSANANWKELEQELELLSQTSDRFHAPPQPEALIQDEPLQARSEHLVADPPKREQDNTKDKEIETNNIDVDSDIDSKSSDSSESSNSSSESEEEERSHLPGHLPMDLEELAGALLEKNQKTKMNCIVEKKKAEEVVDHQPKTIRLPFGVNLTTDPRYEKISGERMVIVCESGTFQRSQPPQTPAPPQEDDDDEQEDDTILIQPVMIPIPQTRFQTHMPQQMPPVIQNNAQLQPPMRFPMRPFMHPMENMRPPVPSMMHIQIQTQSQPQPQQHQQQAPEFPPSPILRHIVQQIIAQKVMQAQRAREEQLRQEQLQQEQSQPTPIQLQEIDESNIPHRFQGPSRMIAQRLPIPEEILTQLNRLPNRDVIVAVSESDSDSEENSSEVHNPNDIRQEMRPEVRSMQRPLPLAIRPIPQVMRPVQQEVRQIPQHLRQVPQELRVMPQEMRVIPQEMRIVQQEMRVMPQELRLPQEMRPIPQEMRTVPQEIRAIPQEMRSVPQEIRQIAQMHLVPQEIHIVPHPERMASRPETSDQEDEQEEAQVPEMRMIPEPQQAHQAPEMRFVQEQRQNAAEMNGRQSYEQTVPVAIPIAMVQQERDTQEPQESQAASSEESRPHFVQPRSVQSVESLDS